MCEDQQCCIHLIQQIRWDASSADFTLYCDACLEGMGFWWPDKCVGFYSPVPDGLDEEQIFYFEALCVLAALNHVVESQHPPPSSRILLYTDNDNTVTIFNTLRCLPHSECFTSQVNSTTSPTQSHETISTWQDGMCLVLP